MTNRTKMLAYLAQLVLTSLSGYLLVRFVSYLWGTGETAAAFEIAWSIPMLLITASGLNALQAVTARFFSELDRDNVHEISNYISSFLNLFALLILPLTACVMFAHVQVAAWAAPGLTATAQDLTAKLIFLLAPLSALFGFGLFFGGIYAAYGKPITAEFVLMTSRLGGVIVATLILVAGITVSPTLLSLIILGTAVLASAFVVYLTKVYLGFSYRFTLNRSGQILRKIGVQSLLFLLVAFLGQFAMIYYRSLLSLIDVRLVAAFSYAFMITYTFSSVIGKLSFFGMALPTQEKFQAGDLDQYRSIVLKSAVIYLAISIIISLLVWINRKLLVWILLGGGAFDAESALTVERLLTILLMAIPATTLIWVLKLPAITGPNRNDLPASEIVVWALLLLATLSYDIANSADWLMWLLVGSFWLRVFIAIAIIFRQLSSERKRTAQADS